MDPGQTVDTPFRSFRIDRSFLSGEPLQLSLQPGCPLMAFFWLVLTVNYVVQDGKSNWLEGMILMQM
jgi:Ca2+/H+ antiporter